MSFIKEIAICLNMAYSAAAGFPAATPCALAVPAAESGIADEGYSPLQKGAVGGLALACAAVFLRHRRQKKKAIHAFRIKGNFISDPARDVTVYEAAPAPARAGRRPEGIN